MRPPVNWPRSSSGWKVPFIRLLGSGDRGSPISPESIYNLIYGRNHGWLVLRITDGSFITITPDGTGFEVR